MSATCKANPDPIGLIRGVARGFDFANLSLLKCRSQVVV